MPNTLSIIQCQKSIQLQKAAYTGFLKPCMATQPNPYARFEAEERHRQQQESFERTESLKQAQIDAQRPLY